MRSAACLLFCLAAFGQELPLRIYTTADGLAGNTIDRIVRDSRGYLWFCTREGISHFDGYQFRNFGVDQGLPGPDFDLVETPSGDYFVGTGDGIARFRPADPDSHFTVLRLAGPVRHPIQSLAVDPAGGLWVGTTAGLYHLDPPHPPAIREWRLRPVDIGLPNQTFEDGSVEALLVDRSGTLWAGTRSGLYRRFPNGQSEGTHGGLPHPDVTALLQDREGRLWAGTQRGVCQILPDQSLAGRRPQDVCPAVPGTAGAVIHSLQQSSDDVLWAGSDGLLMSWIPGADGVSRYTARNGLPGEGTPILSMAEDLAGNLWAGGFGAIRIAKGGFRTYSERDGLDSGFIVSLLEDRSGRLWAVSNGAHGRVFNRFDGGKFQPVRPNVPRGIAWGWGAGQITLQARGGDWWVPTAMGVFRFPKLFDLHPAGAARPSAAYEPANSVYAVFEDSRGGVWMSIQILAAPDGPTRANGLARWDPASGKLRHFLDSDNVPQALATSFAEDRAGAVWIGLSTGSLLRYADGRFRVLPPPNGGTWVEALHVDRSGRLWVANRNGAASIDPMAPESPPVIYSTKVGLETNNVKCIVEDLAGRIYLATGHGVDRISLAPGAPSRIRHYTTADGLARGELVAAFCDRQGTLWFGTREGLSRLDPEPERPASPPPIFITGLRVRGAPRPASVLGESDLHGIQLAPDQNQVELEFVSLRFGTGETLRYQYRLMGRDPNWIPAGEQRTVTYASLAPGGYQWQVRALTADGVASERAATIGFTILPHIWQRWWSQLLAAVFACAILYSLYRYRLTRLLEMERLRTRIATDLHDDIGSTLSQIAILSEVAQRHPSGESREQPLVDIAGLSRELVDSMSDIVWAIDPELDRLDDLTHRMRRFAGDLFSYNGVRVRFQAPGGEKNPRVDADIRRQVYLIFKESLHNSARHSGCSEVDIRLQMDGGWLELALADNGKGFDLARVGCGHGLASMAHRAKLLGGELAVETAPGRGAALKLRVPVGRSPVTSWRTFPHKWVGHGWRLGHSRPRNPYPFVR
jgi:ligand-binding sensor domain-containing protein/signal transduction histidine kinase